MTTLVNTDVLRIKTISNLWRIESFVETAETALPWVVQQVVTLIYEFAINIINRVLDLSFVVYEFAEEVSEGAIGQTTLEPLINAMVTVASFFVVILFLKEILVASC